MQLWETSIGIRNKKNQSKGIWKFQWANPVKEGSDVDIGTKCL